MKREDLTNWMRGGVILISVLLMGITSCDIPVDLAPPGGELTPVLTEEAMKGQIFILSLNALAGRNDSHSGVSGLKKGATDKLDPTIEDNIKKWQPGGIYISALNLEALAKKVEDTAPGSLAAPGSLKDPLKKLIDLLKDPNIISIEPLIVTQEGGQFQRLLTMKMKSNTSVPRRTLWEGKSSELGKQLGLKGLPGFVPDTVKDKNGNVTNVVKKAPDNTPYTWGLLEKVVNGGGNDVKKWLDQIHGLGFSLNYWLVGGTVRGPDDKPYESTFGWGRVQGSANVMGYASAILGSERFFSKILTKTEWKNDNTVTLIGDFPGRSFTKAAAESPRASDYEEGTFDNEIGQWDEPNFDWEYVKDEAKAAVEGQGIFDKIVNGKKVIKNRGRDKLYYFAQAIKAGVDIVGLTQDELYKLKGGKDPWKSRELINVLRNEMGFGRESVVMVGDRTALVRGQHPKWESGTAYTAIGQEMVTVVQLNATKVRQSLYAGADLFHLWRFHAGSIPRAGDPPLKYPSESQSALDTIEEILTDNDETLKTALDRSRWRIIKMKEKNNFRVPSPETPLPDPDFELLEPYELEP